MILALFDNKIFKFCLFRDLERATYNCPWLNTGEGKNTPTLLYDCPWNLFIVIAKPNLMGNCFRRILNGISSFDGDKVFRGIKINFAIFYIGTVYKMKR